MSSSSSSSSRTAPNGASRHDPEDLDLDDEELDDEEQQEEADETLGEPPAPAAPEPATPEPAAAPKAPRRPRRRPPGPGIGAASAPPAVDRAGLARAPFRSHMAVDLMAEFMQRLKEYPAELGQPVDYAVQVFSLDSGAERGRFLGSFNFNSLEGPFHPGERMQELVTTGYHVRRTDRAETYDIRIITAKLGKHVSSAKLPLGSPQEILAVKQQVEEQQRREAERRTYGAGAAAWGAGPAYPTAAGAVPAPAPYYAPPGYGAPAAPPPAPAPSPGEDPTVQQLRANLEYTKGVLDEVLRAQREGRTFTPPAAGVAAPPSAPAPLTEQRVVELVTATVTHVLRTVGVGAAPAAPAPAAPVDRMSTLIRDSMEQAMGAMIQQGVGKLVSTFKETISTMGQPPAVAEEPEEPEPPAPPPDPTEKLPFELVPTAAKWPDGRPVMYPISRETGDISGQGALVGNPFIVEQGMKIVQTIAEAGRAFAERITLPDGSSVVGKTPRSAVDGTPRGVGAPPQAAPQQPQQPPPPPPPPTVARQAAPAPPPESTFPVL